MSGPDLEGAPVFNDGVSTAVTGETGSGKTTVLTMLASQMSVSDGTAVVAHDLDEDFQDLFAEMGFEVIHVRQTDSDVKWNMFEDFGPDETEQLANYLIGEPDGDADHATIHFNTLATTLLKKLLDYLWLEAERHDEQLTNADLKGLAVDMTNEQLADELEDDFPGQADLIRGDGPEDDSPIHNSMESAVTTTLREDFGEDGGFSLREYLENPDGRVIVVDSSVGGIDMMSNAYSFFLDQAIRFAVDNDGVECNFILDEIDAIESKIPSLSLLASKGRSRDTRVLIGIQTVGQLHKIYGQGSGVLGNCPQEIHMGSGNNKSNRHARNAVGERLTTEISHSTSTTEHGTTVSSTESKRMRNPISEGALNEFDTGDAVVITRTGWWIGHIAYFPTVRDRLPGYTNAEMMAHLAEHSDTEPPEGAGSTGAGSTGAATASATGDDDGGKSLIRTFRNLIGFPKHDTGLTPAGREFYGEDDRDD